MSTSLLYHSFGIVGYHYVSQRFHGVWQNFLATLRLEP